MRIEKHPRLRRFLAVCGLVLIFGLLAAFLAVLFTGGDPALAMGLFACLTVLSIVMYLFAAYVRRHIGEDSDS